jgi:hypothetical protein
LKELVSTSCEASCYWIIKREVTHARFAFAFFFFFVTQDSTKPNNYLQCNSYNPKASTLLRCWII